MFDGDCPSCGRVLLGSRRILELHNDPVIGPIATWRCYCGSVGSTSFRTHRRASPEVSPAA
jgi:hypothetical protein